MYSLHYGNQCYRKNAYISGMMQEKIVIPISLIIPEGDSKFYPYDKHKKCHIPLNFISLLSPGVATAIIIGLTLGKNF